MKTAARKQPAKAATSDQHMAALRLLALIGEAWVSGYIAGAERKKTTRGRKVNQK